MTPAALAACKSSVEILRKLGLHGPITYANTPARRMKRHRTGICRAQRFFSMTSALPSTRRAKVKAIHTGQFVPVRIPARLCGIVSTIAASANCLGADEHLSWKFECVGRMELRLPGPVDVAANTKQDLQRRWNPPSFSFSDGQAAPWASLTFLGDVKVLHGFTSPELEAEMERRRRIKESMLARQRNALGGTNSVANDLAVDPLNGIGFQSQGQTYMTLRVGPQIVVWSGFRKASAEEAKRDYEVILKGLRPREVFDVPSEAGVCLPYSFVRDSGNNPRHIAMVYRLREHPDVTVLFEDASAAAAQPHQPKETLTAEYRVNEFWSQYGKVSSLWKQPYRPTKLAGQRGLESFVSIARKDGTRDVGYLAAAPGDAKAEEDRPDLMLYVIRDSNIAKAKGVEPMSEEALLAMARSIAGSVRHR